MKSLIYANSLLAILNIKRTPSAYYYTVQADLCEI